VAAEDGIDGIDYCPVSAEIAILLQVAPFADRYILIPHDYVLPMSGNNETRRAILSKVVAAAASTAGVASAIAFLSDDDPSPQPQDTKDHYIQFSIGNGEGVGDCNVTVPDDMPELESIENGRGPFDQDKVEYEDDHTEVDGSLDSAHTPRYDEIRFDGSLDSSDFHWKAGGGITVEVDGEIKQKG
jgi:hypothetical protein